MDFNLRRILRIDACSMLPSAVEKAFGFFVKICLQALSTRLLQRLYIEFMNAFAYPTSPSPSLSLQIRSMSSVDRLCVEALSARSIINLI